MGDVGQLMRVLETVYGRWTLLGDFGRGLKEAEHWPGLGAIKK
jgi:hypothetical protein